MILLSGMVGINKSYYEAASLDGAGAWKKFWRITVPLMSPAIFYVLIVALINAFQLFPQVMIMTDGGPNGANPGDGGADLPLRLPLFPHGLCRSVLLDLICHYHGVYGNSNESAKEVGEL